MIQEIKTVDDVRIFLNELHDEGLNFHPDDLFEHYIHRDTNQPFYTDEHVIERNRLLAQAFEVCEREDMDIYEVCIDIFMRDFYKTYPPE